MDDTASGTSSDPGSTPDGSGTGDLLYDAFYGGAIGGATIALFFLAVDAFGGRPMFTPSLLGTVMLTDTDPSAVTDVRLDMVAIFSAVHMITYLVLGGVISALVRVMGLATTGLPMVVVGAFVVLTAAFYAGEALLMPGAADVIGAPMIFAANAVTAVAVGGFLKMAHTGD